MEARVGRGGSEGRLGMGGVEARDGWVEAKDGRGGNQLLEHSVSLHLEHSVSYGLMGLPAR